MALPDGSGGGGAAGWLSWEQLSNIAAVFSVFILATLIPLYNLLRNRRKSMKEKQVEKENSHIKEIATEIMSSVEDRLDEHINKQAQVSSETVDALKKLCSKLDNQDKDTNAILSTLRTLTKDFHEFKGQQIAINSKVDFIDEVFRDHIRFGSGLKDG